jgi:hypothetical protein
MIVADLLFSYTDYLGHSWTESIRWQADDVALTTKRKTVKLALMWHETGPTEYFNWTEEK